MSASQTPHAFGTTTTAAEVIDGVDLPGHRAVVTGASSGIGVETVRALAAAGADVTLAVRNTDAGAQVAARLGAELPSGSGKLSFGSICPTGRCSRRTVFANLPKQRGLSPANGPIQEGSGAVITPATSRSSHC
jgi:hypothetical protein